MTDKIKFIIKFIIVTLFLICAIAILLLNFNIVNKKDKEKDTVEQIDSTYNLIKVDGNLIDEDDYSQQDGEGYSTEQYCPD